MAKFDQSGLKRELKLVKRQQLALCMVSALQTATCFGVTIYLGITASSDCYDSIFWSNIAGNFSQILFRALPSLLLMESHRKNYRRTVVVVKPEDSSVSLTS